MDLSKTNRGFVLGKFKDTYGHECSLQESSNVDPHIWFGIDNVKEITVFEYNGDVHTGKYVKFPVPKGWDFDTRMHLSRKQVQELLPQLQMFAEFGVLNDDIDGDTLYRLQLKEFFTAADNLLNAAQQVEDSKILASVPPMMNAIQELLKVYDKKIDNLK